MTPSDRKASIEECDNGWLLTYWTRDKSEQTQRREVFQSDGQLFQRIREIYGRVPGIPVSQTTGD
jgi:hypothetical protein